MQPMSDKELDKLFQHNFDAFETEPSAAVWEGITAELDKTSKKKAFSVRWMAAASILVVLGAALFLLRPEKTTKLRAKTNSATVMKRRPANTGSDTAPQQKLIAYKPAVAARAVKTTAVKKRMMAATAKTRPEADDIPEIKEAAKEIAANTEKTHVVPERHAAVQPVAGEAGINEARAHQPVLASSVAAHTNETAADTPAAPRRRIKSLGDLVNRVMAKVDPRQDKLIEFKDTDEGTEVTGINLGLFKIKNNTNTHK